MDWSSSDAVHAALAAQGYIADTGLTCGLYLASVLDRPLLLEGVPGVGKTEAARAVAASLGRKLIRLQCYEGVDGSQALYDWNHPRQLLAAKLLGTTGGPAAWEQVDTLYGPEFLAERPLLAALRAGSSALLLIDEVDRADDQFEALLLEFLSDFSISIPEIGTVRASEPPMVILTSNRTRELHDALKRRCLYHWIELPTRDAEIDIIRVQVPDADAALAAAVADAVARMREMYLRKPPGPSESVEWARALVRASGGTLDVASAGASLSVVLKVREDVEMVRAGLSQVISADE